MNTEELAKELWNLVAIKGAGQKKIEALLNKERPENLVYENAQHLIVIQQFIEENAKLKADYNRLIGDLEVLKTSVEISPETIKYLLRIHKKKGD